MGASVPLWMAATGAAAAGAVAVESGAVGNVAGAVHDFTTNPTVGPGWLTGATSKTGRTSLAKQLAQAEAMVRNSGVEPRTP